MTRASKKDANVLYNSLWIHRPVVIMRPITRIRVRCEKGKPVARRGRKA
jgi:hypothetical protein